MLLSILICSVLDRADQLKALVAKIGAQVSASGAGDEVEVITDVDDGSKAIGRKRNDLLAGASGEYVCFVDDDDGIAGYYVEKMLAAIRLARPDCIGMVGELRVIGKSPQRFVHSLRHRDYRDTSGALCRPPNHLNPIRREIALNYKFPHIDRGEDTDYAMQMARDGVLKTEVFVPDVLYLYEPSASQAKRAGG